MTRILCLQGSFFRSPTGCEQGTSKRNVRRKDHRQKSVEGQRGLSGQRNQSIEKVRSNTIIMCNKRMCSGLYII